jgi:subtilisin family serine protease
VPLVLPQFAPGEVLAVNPSASAIAQAKSMGFSVTASDQFSNLGTRVVHLGVPPGWSSAESMRLLRGALADASILFNNYYRPILSATDVDTKADLDRSVASVSGGCPKDRCYGPSVISWDAALAQCSRGLRVGIIDTGIDSQHPTFAHQAVQIGSVRENERSAPNAHGTGVLALLAGEPKSSTPGLIPNAKFFAADIFFIDANGAPISDTVHLLRALEWLEAWDVKVINLSLTGPKDELIEKAISRLVQRGVIVVAAAGNDGPGAPAAYPAAYPDVIAVTAVDRNLRGYRHANQGDYVDLAAPGVDIWTALPNARQGTLTGTSLAAPFVSALVATLYEGLPHKTKAAVLQRLQYADLGRPGRDPVYGSGLVRAPTSCAPKLDQDPSLVSMNGAPVIRASGKDAVKRSSPVSPSGL